MRSWIVAAAFSLLSAAPALAQSLDGDWAGTLDTGQEKLRGVFHVLPQPGGLPGVTLDSPDQEIFGIPGQVMKLEGSKVEMIFIPIAATLKGDLSADGQTLTSTYSQNGRDFPLVLTRRAAAPQK
jgi:hypothetical protein